MYINSHLAPAENISCKRCNCNHVNIYCIIGEEQKKQEHLKLEIEDKERMKRLLEDQNSSLQKQQNEMKESYENNLRKQKEEYARQHDQDMENLQTNMKLAMEEKERLVKDGFEEHLMKEELREAKEDIADC